MVIWFFFFKQKTAYELRIGDWSSDVCSSDLPWSADHTGAADQGGTGEAPLLHSEGGGHLVVRDQAGHRARLGDEAVDLRRVDPGVLAGRTGSLDDRSEERRGGTECVSSCRSRW